jgi:hypothetical protein
MVQGERGGWGKWTGEREVKGFGQRTWEERKDYWCK